MNDMTLYNVRNATIASIIVPESRLDQFKVKSHCCLKGLAQAKIIKKSVILFRVLNMTI